MTIDEVAQTIGLTPYTIRYYEKAALIPPVTRLENGRRVFGAEDLIWLNMVQTLRMAGMTVQQIRRYVAEVQQGCVASTNERIALLTQQQQILQQKLADIT